MSPVASILIPPDPDSILIVVVSIAFPIVIVLAVSLSPILIFPAAVLDPICISPNESIAMLPDASISNVSVENTNESSEIILILLLVPVIYLFESFQ